MGGGEHVYYLCAELQIRQAAGSAPHALGKHGKRSVERRHGRRPPGEISGRRARNPSSKMHELSAMMWSNGEFSDPRPVGPFFTQIMCRVDL